MTRYTGYAEIKRAIIAALTPDLLTPQYRAGLKPGDAVETGHCAVASEAFYYLSGGKDAGFMPVVCGYTVTADGKMHFGADRARAERDAFTASQASASDAFMRETDFLFMRETPHIFMRETHWWIRGPKDGKRGAGDVFDITAAQYDAPFPYEKGHNTGFMQPQQKPSKRAQIVMDRVIENIGVEKIKAWRRANISAFKKSHHGKNAPSAQAPRR